MNWRLIAAMPLVIAVGCVADSDGDGLSNKQEEELGLNPEVADTDGDGLTDGDEIEVHNTDPLNADSDDDRLIDGEEIAAGSDPDVQDTDGDGYFDGDEVTEGSDPTDEDSLIYEGHWPYYWDKDNVGGQNNGQFVDGKRALRFGTMRDQFGDKVDFFDFYNEDKPIVVDISAVWCGPCNQVAAWLDGDDTQASWMAPYVDIREAVDNGDVYWITIMGEQIDRSDATGATAKEWYDQFPHHAVPVLADKDREHQNYSGLGAWPWMYVLTPKLKVYDSSGGQGSAMESVRQLL